MTDRKQAIAYAKEHRQTHIEWADYWQSVVEGNRNVPRGISAEMLEEHGVNSLAEAQNGVDHHIESIERYDLIIKILKTAPDG